MTKRFVLSRDDLVNLFHEFTAYTSEEVKKIMASNRMLMLSDRINMINSFLDKYLVEFPLDDLLDEVEKQFTSYTGRGFEDIYNALEKKEPEYKENYKKHHDDIEDYLKKMDDHCRK